ncbi:MAG: type II and III secretion system protein [Candidatus Adiutrix intracellularis]|nr:type II and III secretion system protein [Candidatus Adiutrix intracellularis]
MVKDCDTVAIGGILREEEYNGSIWVPSLYCLPFLRWPFKSNNTSNTKKTR